MNHNNQRLTRSKRIIRHLLLLTLLVFVVIPAQQAVAGRLLSAYSDEELYRLAFQYRKEGKIELAALYLFAYQMRDSASYRAHKTSVDREMGILKGKLSALVGYKTRVERDLAKCGCYQCGSCQLQPGASVRSSQTNHPTPTPDAAILPPPPDMAVVCESQNYQGRCSFLVVGIYNNAGEIGLPNDTISSVLLGNSVEITVYAHGSLTGPYRTFTSNVSNLSSYWIDDTYKWNDNVTSIRVDWK